MTTKKNYQLTELKLFSAIATNFTYLKTKLVRRSKKYLEARFKIKRQLFGLELKKDLLVTQFFGAYY